MHERAVAEGDIHRFILTNIDTVPHMEALLLLWDTRPRLWSAEDLSRRLFVDRPVIQTILSDLAARRLVRIEEQSGRAGTKYGYEPDSGTREELIEAVLAMYRCELVRTTVLIQNRPR
jgi:hypothetical protein